MAERLEDWGPRMQRGLRRAPGSVAAELRKWRDEVRLKVIRATPRDKGGLQRSIEADIKLDNKLHGHISVSSEDPAAKVLEEGGTLRGQPWMAIPLRPDVRARGTPRKDGGLFALTTRAGQTFLVSRRGGALDFRWKLQRQVHRKAQPFIAPTIEKARKPLAKRLLARIHEHLGPRGAR